MSSHEDYFLSLCSCFMQIYSLVREWRRPHIWNLPALAPAFAKGHHFMSLYFIDHPNTSSMISSPVWETEILQTLMRFGEQQGFLVVVTEPERSISWLWVSSLFLNCQLKRQANHHPHCHSPWGFVRPCLLTLFSNEVKTKRIIEFQHFPVYPSSVLLEIEKAREPLQKKASKTESLRMGWLWHSATLTELALCLGKSQQ